MDCNDLNRRVRYALMLDDADVFDLLGFSAYPADIAQVCGWRLKEGEQGHVKCPPEAIKRMLDGLIVQRRGVKADAPVNGSSATNTRTGAATSKAAEKISDQNGQAGHSERDSELNREINNNDVLKQLRIALSLKVDDVHALITEGGGKLGKGEVNALFRKSSARNYRRCGDQVLRWFLAGLAARRQSQQME